VVIGNTDHREGGNTMAEQVPMTRDELAAWLTMHGARPDELEASITEFLGRTEAEMDAENEKCHGSMA
jgi:hypothetical protein